MTMTFANRISSKSHKARTPGRGRPLSFAASRAMEQLESRQMLNAPIHVANMDEDGAGSLAQAIRDANSTPGLDTIVFDVDGTIALTGGDLPEIDEALVIDGTTAPGYSAARPSVMLDGSGSFAMNGLTLGPDAAGSTIQGLWINGFYSNAGIYVASDSNTLQNNWLGMSADFSTDFLAQNSDGIYVAAGTGNVIRNNVISNNANNGISVDSGASDTRIEANVIGLTPDGSTVLANNGNGIWLSGTTGVTVGGSDASSRNLIAGFGGDGVRVVGSSNVGIYNNFIGTDITGTASAPNPDFGGSGVYIQSSTDVFVGSASAGNLISGNASSGIYITGNTDGGITVQGNRIGTDASGVAPLPNELHGIDVIDSPGLVIGGAGEGEGNIISANVGGGIYIEGDGTVVLGNRIGTSADGLAALGNGNYGIDINGSNNVIGGSDTAANTIAFNTVLGVGVGSGQGNAITQNRIYGNTVLGIDLGVDGPTANGTMSDSDPNRFQLYPVLAAPVRSNGHVSISGTLNAEVGRVYNIEFFASTQAHPSTHAQGEYFLGSISITALMDGPLTFTSPALAVTDAMVSFTATATDDSGNTSEFSNPVAAISTVSTTTTLASDRPQANAGDAVTLTATVTPNSAHSIPTGTVDFMEGSTLLGSVTLDLNGQAHLILTTLPVGIHDIVARYRSNDVTLLDSQSAPLSQRIDAVVTEIATQTHLTTSSAAPTYGDALTLTARITLADGSAAAALDNGKVEFTYFTRGHFVTTGPTAVVNGVATLTLSSIDAGVHDVSAVYFPATGSLYLDSNDRLSQLVNQAQIQILVDNFNRTYGTPNPALTGSYTGLKNGDSIAVAFSTPATIASPVNAYPVTASVSDPDNVLSNYTLNVVPGALAVEPAVLTVTADSKQMVYGGALPALSASFAGFVNDDTVSSVTLPILSTTATPASPVGVYTITASGSTAANYTFVYQSGTLTISKAALTLSVDSKTRTYAQPNPALTGSLAGLKNGDSLALSFSTAAGLASNVGAYPITGSVSGTAASNYNLTVLPGTLTITQASPILSWAAPAPIVYGTPLSASQLNASANIAGTFSYAPLAGTVLHAGSAQPLSVLFTPADSLNYTSATAAVSLDVTSAPLTITALDASKVYGQANPALSLSYSGFVNGDSAADLASLPTFSTPATAASPVGVYDINVAGASSADYTISYQLGHLAVTPALLSIRADDQSVVYGNSAALSASYSGFVNGDSPASLTSPVQLSTSATAASHVGLYEITASGAASPNYTISFESGHLAITPALLTVTANDQAVVYGDAPTLSASYAGFVNGDSILSLSSPAMLSVLNANTDVGTYTIVASGAASADYVFAYVNGTLTITRAHAVIVANDASRAYGANNPGLSGSIQGLKNGDSLLASFSTSATAASSVGGYAITASVSGAKASNYDFTVQSGMLTVTPATLTITAASASRVYGDANPSFSGTISGIQNGDNISAVYSTSANAASPVGDYAITATANGPAGKLANYTIVVNPGNLNVTRRGLTVTADAKSKISGAADPALTYQVSGGSLVNGDTLSGSLTRAAGEGTGVYPILQGSLSASANYALSYVSASFTITAPASTPFSASGRVLKDTTGNGVSPDDAPFAGVTVNLYADSNNNGQLDSSDAQIDSTTSGADGSYSFAPSRTGRLFIQQAAPSGYIRTAPALSSYYTVTAAPNTSIANQDFDNYQGCNCNDLTGISFLINGTTTVTDLRGNVHQGDVVTARFTVPQGMSKVVTLVSYTAPGSTFVASDAYLQKIYDIDSGSFGPGPHSLTVTVPDSYFQVDFVCGLAIDQFGPANSNEFYTPQGRLISADNGGTNAYVQGTSTLAGFVYLDSDNDGVKEAGEAPIAGVTLKLTGADSSGQAVSATTVTNANGRYAFPNLKPGSYTITEIQPAGYQSGKITLPAGASGTVTATGFSNVQISAADAPATHSDYNFGELKASSLSGSVYLDSDNDGQRSSCENGIANVTIRLVDSAGQVVATTATNSSGYYTFNSVAPGTYTLLETQPAGYVDGEETAGSLGGDDTGDNNTIAAIAVGVGQTGVNYNFGELREISVCQGDAATIGFWQNKNGQNLIKSFNGSASARNLANWLASSFPNLYGATSNHNMTGRTNTDVAALFKTFFSVSGQKLDAQVLAVALAVYTTDSQLGGNAGARYGFNLSSAGLAAKVYNIGSNGAAFDVANNTKITVSDALDAANRHAVNGVLYNGNTTLRNMANTVFDGINNTGDIV